MQNSPQQVHIKTDYLKILSYFSRENFHIWSAASRYFAKNPAEKENIKIYQ